MENNTEQDKQPTEATAPVSPYVVIDMRHAGAQPFNMMQSALMAAEDVAKVKAATLGELSTQYIVISKDDPIAKKVEALIEAEIALAAAKDPAEKE